MRRPNARSTVTPAPLGADRSAQPPLPPTAGGRGRASGCRRSAFRTAGKPQHRERLLRPHRDRRRSPACRAGPRRAQALRPRGGACRSPRPGDPGRAHDGRTASGRFREIATRAVARHRGNRRARNARRRTRHVCREAQRAAQRDRLCREGPPDRSRRAGCRRNLDGRDRRAAKVSLEAALRVRARHRPRRRAPGRHASAAADIEREIHDMLECEPHGRGPCRDRTGRAVAAGLPRSRRPRQAATRARAARRGQSARRGRAARTVETAAHDR